MNNPVRTILIALLMTLATQGGAFEKFYGSFVLNTDIPDTLFFTKEIKANDSFELRKALRNQDIQNIVLASPGGSIWEALQIAGIIFDKKLRTYIPREANCASACSFLFFAGHERLADGKLGVHQMYSSDFKKQQKVGQTQYVTQFTVSEVIGFLNEFGTPAFVYERMFQDIEMYYFDEQELTELKSQTFALDDLRLAKITGYTEKLLRQAKPSEVDTEQVDEKEVSESEKTSETDVQPKTDKIEIAEKELTQKIQARLAALGCNPGPADGIWGKRTQSAALDFAVQANLNVNAGSNFKTNAFLRKLEGAKSVSCPKQTGQAKKQTSPTAEVWSGYEYCAVIDGKISRSVTVQHVDSQTFLINFQKTSLSKKKTIRFNAQNGSKNGNYNFKIGSARFKIKVDFDRGLITGRLTETNLAVRAVMATVLLSGYCDIHYERPS